MPTQNASRLAGLAAFALLTGAPTLADAQTRATEEATLEAAETERAVEGSGEGVETDGSEGVSERRARREQSQKSQQAQREQSAKRLQQ